MALGFLRRFALRAGIGILAGTAVVGAPAAVSAKSVHAGQSAQDVPQQIAAIADRYRIKQGFPGATIAWIDTAGREGRVAVGVTDPGGKTPMPVTARMLGASTGKSFVAAEILILAQQGKLSLDDPLRKWLSDKPWFAGLAGADQITVRLLLQHMSGLPEIVGTAPYLQLIGQRLQDNPDAPPTIDEIIATADALPQAAPTGSRFQYSDVNYLILGEIVEKAEGRRWYDIAEERFLKPFKLSETEPSNRRLLPGLVQGVTDVAGARATLPEHVVGADGRLVYNPAVEWTGGGFITTARDLARWARALFDGRAIGAAATTALFEHAVPMNKGSAEYGYGVMRLHAPTGVLYGHLGDIPGYRGIFLWSPNRRFALAVQVNSSKESINVPPMAAEIAAVLSKP